MPFEICISEIRIKDPKLEKMLEERIKMEILLERLNEFLQSEGMYAKTVVNEWV